MVCRKVNVFYGDKQAIQNVSIDIGHNEVMAMIGPSGCGKSTFLRCLNRMNDTVDSCRVTGEILLDGHNIYDKEVDVVPLRAQVGMVFQKPNPFPKSIFDNVAYGPRIHGLATTRPNWRSWSRGPCAGPGSGKRSRTGSTSRAPAFPAVSSSGFASPGPSP